MTTIEQEAQRLKGLFEEAAGLAVLGAELPPSPGILDDALACAAEGLAGLKKLAASVASQA